MTTRGMLQVVRLRGAIAAQLLRARVHAVRIAARVITGHFLEFVQAEETTTAGDALRIAFTRVLSDAPAALDAVLLQLRRPVSDVASAADALLLEVRKGLLDGAGAADVLRIVLQRPDVADAAAVADAVRLQTGRLIAEALALGDTARRDVTKVLAEAPTAADAMRRTLYRSIFDVVGVNDMLIQGGRNEAAVQESPAASDSGYLRGQGYASFDYFAEDYVGYSRSF